MAEYDKERTLEETSTWAVAVVCLVLLVISLSVEHFIHLVEKVSLKDIPLCMYMQSIFCSVLEFELRMMSRTERN